MFLQISCFFFHLASEHDLGLSGYTCEILNSKGSILVGGYFIHFQPLETGIQLD
jgi:hypothetical protein